ncbi:Alpha/Beta hydrolase protein [Phyllosticta citribraziliensis]|uniref:Alpha/Beta hydrolase protein n=1 Tax=Phyllosticta citribraziliensis TaxID=989973 RepID=A0ABR1LLL8_9PEZI
MTAHYILNPSAEHSHTVIFLHGRDSTAPEFAVEFFESQASDDKTLPEIFPSFKWVFPTSTLRNSARFSIEMSQWFDMWSLEDPEEQKETQKAGLSESISSILIAIEDEASLIGTEKIILGGISQGCATAIHALLQGERKLGAFVGLCSWLPFQAEIQSITKTARSPAETRDRLRCLFRLQHHRENKLNSALETPVLLAHSEDDEVVSIRYGEKLSRGLMELGMPVEWRTYKHGGHWVNEPQGIDDMVGFSHEAGSFS